jgi:hypothetical protein
MSSADLNPGDISTRLREALAAVEGLPVDDVRSIDVLIRAGEWSLALETLCTQISEYELGLDSELRSELMRLGEVADVPVTYLLDDAY